VLLRPVVTQTLDSMACKVKLQSWTFKRRNYEVNDSVDFRRQFGF